MTGVLADRRPSPAGARPPQDPPPPEYSVLLGGTALVLVVTLALWWSGRPDGAGAFATGVGQLAGFACSVFALGTAFLMARVPSVDRWLGVDRALIWHRRFATAMVGTLVVHIVATVVGYAAAAHVSIGRQIGDLLSSYPDLITATVGAALLLSIALSSIRAIRKRLPYESWLFAHWYVYPALFLSFGHELSDGSSFLNASVPTLLWTWLHVAVAVTLLWYRLILPAYLASTHPLRVSKVRRENSGAVTITLAGQGLYAYRAVAGQHLRLRFLTPHGWWQSHPYSLSARPTTKQFRITVVASGDFSEELQGIKPGTKVVVTGAHGDLTAARRHTNQVVLIGGGSGIVPLRAVLEDLPPEVHVRVLYRARDHESVVLSGELEKLTARHNAEFHLIVGRRNPDAPRDILTPGGLDWLLPGMANGDVYVCGAASFVDTVTHSLAQIGVPAARVHTERFDA